MITLYQFASAYSLPNLSPFCMKVETYLRMVEIPFQVNFEGNLAKAPKGKLPYIDDDGVIIADSSHIIEHVNKKYQKDLDQHLTEEQRAKALAVKILFEDHFYWIAVYSRWMNEESWPHIRNIFFGKLPPVIKAVVPIIARRQVRQNLKGQGLGRHSAAEIYEFGRQDIHAIATLLGDQDYFLGTEPSSLDAIAYSFLTTMLGIPLPSILQDYARQYPNLEQYCQRMRSRYYTKP